MTDTNQIKRYNEAPAQLQAPAPVNVGEIIGEIMRKGVDPSAAASAIKELVQLQNMQEDRWAKGEWWRAFARVKAKTKTIQAEKPVPRKEKIGGHETGKMITAFWTVPLNDLLDAIEPLCQPEGLDVSFDSKREGNIVTGMCIVAGHGHTETRSFAKNIANAQGADPDVGAVTTCQRKSLMLMFAIRSEHMEADDPRMLGELLPPADVEELETRCAALKSDKYRAALLKYLGADGGAFSDVYSSRLADARRSLMQAEAKAKTNPSPQAAVSPPRHTAAPINPTNGESAPTSSPAPQTTGAVAQGNGSVPYPVIAASSGPPPASAPVTGTGPASGAKASMGPTTRNEPSAAPVREHAPSMGVQEAEGGGGGGVLPRTSEIAPPSPPDAFEHWRTMSPADTRSTWEAMNGDARTKAWAQMPKDVRAVVRAKLESTTK